MDSSLVNPGTANQHRRRDSASLGQDVDVTVPPKLGGKSAVILFLVVLAAFVTQSAFTQVGVLSLV